MTETETLVRDALDTIWGRLAEHSSVPADTIRAILQELRRLVLAQIDPASPPAIYLAAYALANANPDAGWSPDSAFRWHSARDILQALTALWRGDEAVAREWVRVVLGERQVAGMAGKPFDHPDYRIEGTNFFSLSKWKRENDPAPPPKYKVGDVVVVTRVMEITHVGADCDGTPLYGLNNDLFGIGEEALRLATEEEAKDA